MSTARTPRHRAAFRSRTLVAVALAATLTACGGDGGTSPNNAIDKITVDPLEAVILAGKTTTLTAHAAGASGQAVTGSGVQWSTSDAAIATVSPAGVVSGVATGVARITATANSRSGSSLVSVSTATQQTVPAGGATVSTPGGEVKVTVPGGALPSGGSVNIEPVTTGTAPGTTVPGTVFKIGVFGISTGPRPTITVRYSVSGLPPGFDETKLALSRKIGAFWVPLPSTVNTVEKTITAILPASGMITSAATSFAQAFEQASVADEEATVGGTLYSFVPEVTSLQLTVGDRRRVTGRVIQLATNTAVPLTSPNASPNSGSVVSLGAATASGNEMSVEIVASAPGTASVRLAAAITSGGSAETFAADIAVSVAPAASLNVTVGGLPAGVNGDVTVTGPGGFSRKLTASQNLDAITPGSYTITAASVSSGGQTYAPSPPSQTLTVAAGQTQSAGVQYLPTLGTLAVNISGLPAGTNAAITVTGPGGFNQSVTGPTSFAGLTPGTFTITATGVTVAGQLYAPTPAAQSVVVVAGQTTNATVAYAVNAGAIRVEISGLPAGVSARVTIRGANNFSRTVTTTETVTGLVAGAYTIDADPIDTPDQRYTPAVSATTVNVVAGQTAQVSVPHAPSLGTLTVTITGCDAPDVRVSGPNNYLKQGVTNGQIITRLVPGTYLVSAGGTDVGAPPNNVLCKPVNLAQAVAVTAGASGSVTVPYVHGYLIFASKVAASANDLVAISAPACTPVNVCGDAGFYPVGTVINISSLANPLSRIAGVTGPGTCNFAPPATDVTSSFNCSFTVTTNTTVVVTFQVLPPASIEKASGDSTSHKQSEGAFICCSAVRVLNARGTPVPNVSVTWVSSGTYVGQTDASGVSGGIGLNFGTTPAVGTYPLTASITTGTNQTKSITFTYFVVAGMVVGETDAQSRPTSASPRPAPAPDSVMPPDPTASRSTGRPSAAARVPR